MAREEVVAKVAKAALDAAGKAVGFDSAGGLMGALLQDQKGWDPVVPADLHANPLPPIAADGTAECWQCKSRLPFDQLDIAGNAYSCRPCLLRTQQQNAARDAAAIDVDSVKIGRGRWWVFPLIAVLLLAGLVVFFFVTKKHSL